MFYKRWNYLAGALVLVGSLAVTLTGQAAWAQSDTGGSHPADAPTHIGRPGPRPDDGLRNIIDPAVIKSAVADALGITVTELEASQEAHVTLDELAQTQGVAVVGYRTDTLPAFWTAESDLEIPLRLDSANEIAEFQKVRDDLRLEAGLLVANPIPADDEIPSNIIDGYIETAQSEMAAQGISGKAVTPFLLQRIFELSEGRSLKANIALVKNNARLAADIAVAFHAPSRP